MKTIAPYYIISPRFTIKRQFEYKYNVISNFKQKFCKFLFINNRHMDSAN